MKNQDTRNIRSGSGSKFLDPAGLSGDQDCVPTVLYSKYDHYNMTCLSCGQKDHPLEKCKFIRYTHIQCLIVHKHLWR